MKITIPREELIKAVRLGESYDTAFKTLLQEKGCPFGPGLDLLPDYRYIKHTEANGDVTIQWIKI